MFDLPEKCTIWNKGASDGFGGVSWDGPHKEKCRIYDKSEKFTDTNGDTLVSSSVLYSDSVHLRAGSIVLQYEHSDALTPPSKANDARGRVAAPSCTDMIKVRFV